VWLTDPTQHLPAGHRHALARRSFQALVEIARQDLLDDVPGVLRPEKISYIRRVENLESLSEQLH
jgi:hypothetical protein